MVKSAEQLVLLCNDHVGGIYEVLMVTGTLILLSFSSALDNLEQRDIEILSQDRNLISMEQVIRTRPRKA